MMHRLFVLLPLIIALDASAQSTRKLEGLIYHGTVAAEPMEGCEGCGNRGRVSFLADSRLDYLLPGSDIIDRRTYTRKGDRLTLEGGDIVIELKGDSLFVLAHDYRYPYVREKEGEDQ